MQLIADHRSECVVVVKLAWPTLPPCGSAPRATAPPSTGTRRPRRGQCRTRQARQSASPIRTQRPAAPPVLLGVVLGDGRPSHLLDELFEWIAHRSNSGRLRGARCMAHRRDLPWSLKAASPWSAPEFPGRTDEPRKGDHGQAPKRTQPIASAHRCHRRYSAASSRSNDAPRAAARPAGCTRSGGRCGPPS